MVSVSSKFRDILDYERRRKRNPCDRYDGDAAVRADTQVFLQSGWILGQVEKGAFVNLSPTWYYPRIKNSYLFTLHYRS